MMALANSKMDLPLLRGVAAPCLNQYPALHRGRILRLNMFKSAVVLIIIPLLLLLVFACSDRVAVRLQAFECPRL